MTPDPTRRRLLLAAPSVALGTWLLDPGAGGAAPAPPASPAMPAVPAGYPTQDPALAREMVGVSHFNLERVRELVETQPELARAAYDWGFGDWETALGAASHTGQRPIADYLIRKGARPDIFAAAMLGQLDVVKAFVAARPSIQGLHGPHGITLLAHAEAGGANAAPVLHYLRELGGADAGYAVVPLTDIQRAAYPGIYAFGEAPEDRFEIALDRGELSIRRGEGVRRRLFHRGNHEFHPAGAPSARIRFTLRGERAGALGIYHPELVVEAQRVVTAREAGVGMV